MATILNVGDDDFRERVLEWSGPALVDFWGDWCPPCHDQESVTRQFAEHLDGVLRVFRVDVDRNRGTLSRFGVRGVPSLLVFFDGELLDRHVGKLSFKDLVAFVEGALESAPIEGRENT